ncbi:MAG: hypothetical protein JSV00_02390 [bacterium]|nr:MAG: hypothetical protein JSV00_02390 [bacterium]
MAVMNITGRNPLILALLLTAMAACATAPPPTAEETGILERARADIARGDFDWALYDLERYLEGDPHRNLLAEAHFLAGEAAKGGVDRSREEGKYTGLVLGTIIGPLMEKAYFHYLQAGGAARQEELAARSYTMAAVMVDIDYMKRFEEALSLYRRVMDRYPASASAPKAAERYGNLEDKFRKLQMSPHGVGVSP